MSIDIMNIAAASFMPGLQNQGNISGSVTINGTLYGSPSSSNTSNTYGKINITLPDPNVISLFRITLPSANGDLSSKWFPLIGVLELTDNIAQWRLILYLMGSSTGRTITYNFVNLSTSNTTLNVTLDYYAHLYSYPWSQP